MVSFTFLPLGLTIFHVFVRIAARIPALITMSSIKVSKAYLVYAVFSKNIESNSLFSF
jgi:hypothetical protein